MMQHAFVALPKRQPAAVNGVGIVVLGWLLGRDRCITISFKLFHLSVVFVSRFAFR
jgi:hypothetical protein